MTKEVRNINKLDNCDNIVKCLAVSYGPLALMLELSCFDFIPFGESYNNKIAYSSGELLNASSITVVTKKSYILLIIYLFDL